MTNIGIWSWPVIGALAGAVAGAGNVVDEGTKIPIGAAIGVSLALLVVVRKGQKWVDDVSAQLDRNHESVEALRKRVEAIPCVSASMKTTEDCPTPLHVLSQARPVKTPED